MKSKWRAVAVALAILSLVSLACSAAAQMKIEADRLQAERDIAEAKLRSFVAAEVIQKFTTKETEFFEAWKEYTYRQVADIRILSVNKRPRNERMMIESEIVFNDDGQRDVRILKKSGRIQAVGFTDDDDKVSYNILPFALTTQELPHYNVKFKRWEKVGEQGCFVFSVKPKSAKRGRFYFEGQIWVDDQDYQILRTKGKAVPQSRDIQFPEFETIRQMVDNKYWFPVRTNADSELRFRFNKRVRIEEMITFEGYKRFTSEVRIDFGSLQPVQ
jgi:hypothetical protein